MGHTGCATAEDAANHQKKGEGVEGVFCHQSAHVGTASSEEVSDGGKGVGIVQEPISHTCSVFAKGGGYVYLFLRMSAAHAHYPSLLQYYFLFLFKRLGTA